MSTSTTTPKLSQASGGLAAPAFIYVRVKRQHATYFLRVEPSERVGSLKSKLEELVQRPPSEIRLVKLGSGGGRGSGDAAASSSSVDARNQEPLDDDDARLADLGVGNDDVLALCLRDKGSKEWEGVDVRSSDRGAE